MVRVHQFDERVLDVVTEQGFRAAMMVGVVTVTGVQCGSPYHTPTAAKK